MIYEESVNGTKISLRKVISYFLFGLSPDLLYNF